MAVGTLTTITFRFKVTVTTASTSSIEEIIMMIELGTMIIDGATMIAVSGPDREIGSQSRISPGTSILATRSRRKVEKISMTQGRTYWRVQLKVSTVK